VNVLARTLARQDHPDPAVLVIEPMRKRHLRQVLAIEERAYPKPWSRSVFESELDQVRDRSRYYVVARAGRAVVGYAGLWFVP
jgi:[ribosomal protein S18]-alanine N-acetyltransferase